MINRLVNSCLLVFKKMLILTSDNYLEFTLNSHD